MPHEKYAPAAAQAAEVAEVTTPGLQPRRVLRNTRDLLEVLGQTQRYGPQEPQELRRALSDSGSLQSLSDVELVSLLLRRYRSKSSVREIALEVTAKLAGLASARTSGDECLRHLGRGNAATLLATVELGRRLARVEMLSRNVFDQPEAVATYLSLRYARPDQEVMGALYFNAQRRLLAEREIFRGTLSRAAVEPRTILKHALEQSASGFVLFHSHPSGDPSPSNEDLSFTRRMAGAGELLGVRLLYHLILGGGRWVALNDA